MPMKNGTRSSQNRPEITTRVRFFEGFSSNYIFMQHCTSDRPAYQGVLARSRRYWSFRDPSHATFQRTKLPPAPTPTAGPTHHPPGKKSASLSPEAEHTSSVPASVTISAVSAGVLNPERVTPTGIAGIQRRHA